MRYFFLLILLAASIGFFVIYVKPRYTALQTTRAQIAASTGSLTTADNLKQSREQLIAKYNSIPKTDLDNLKSLLPDSVDNIRLIIQINALATKNGLSSVRNVDYQTQEDATKAASATNNTVMSLTPVTAKIPYGEFTVSFETVGQYSNFLAFVSELEANLRLVDITKVDFSTDASQGVSGSMRYVVTLKTYWLKQ